MGKKAHAKLQSGLRQHLRQDDITGIKAQCLELRKVLMGFVFVCKLTVSLLSWCHHSTAPSCWKLPSLLTSATNTHVLIITILNGLYRVNRKSPAAIFMFLQWKSPREKRGGDWEGTLSFFWALSVITFLMVNLWYLILCTMNTLCGSPDLIWHWKERVAHG